MAKSTNEHAVRDYLVALRDPSALRDDNKIAALERKLADSNDELERLRLRQEIMNSQSPSLDGYEAAFVEHAKAWADEHGISGKAFAAEGVPSAVLRRAGFSVGRGRPSGRGRRTRSRVSTEQVRAALPRGAFTIKKVQEKTGASPAVVRKVIQAEEAAGNLKRVGPDPDHSGPGRAPTLYQRA
jgi:hypothetical protein